TTVMNRKKAASRIATSFPNQPASVVPTAVASEVTCADWPSPAGTVTITAHVASRYATITANEPHTRERVIDRSSLISTPMLRGTSTPRSASTTNPKKLQLVRLIPVSADGDHACQ